MSATATESISFEVRDVSGQKAATVKGCPGDASIGEVIPSVLAMLDLPPNDLSGQPISHALRRDRDGAILHDSDLVGEVLDPSNEVLILQPNVDAGGK